MELDICCPHCGSNKVVKLPNPKKLAYSNLNQEAGFEMRMCEDCGCELYTVNVCIVVLPPQ